MRNDGSATFLIMGALIFLSVLALGTFLHVQYAQREVVRDEKREEYRKSLIIEAEKVVSALLEDQTPYADSYNDPVWEYISTPEDSRVTIMIKDISSYYGLNWIRKDILDHCGLLKHGRSSNDFQQFRWETGIRLEFFPDYQPFFSEGTVSSYFTPYNYFNINICDEFALENMVLTRTGDKEKAELLRKKIQDFWMGGKPEKPNMIEPDTLEGFLGIEYSSLFPVVNAEPVMNIHFTPIDILYQLLSFHYHDIERDRVDYLIANRNNEEWSIDDLRILIGEKYQSTFLHHYIGVTTWFWQICISITDDRQNSFQLQWIIARVPQDNTMEKKYRLVQEEFR